jgi:hypothetical protein
MYTVPYRLLDCDAHSDPVINLRLDYALLRRCRHGQSRQFIASTYICSLLEIAWALLLVDRLYPSYTLVGTSRAPLTAASCMLFLPSWPTASCSSSIRGWASSTTLPNSTRLGIQLAAASRAVSAGIQPDAQMAAKRFLTSGVQMAAAPGSQPDDSGPALVPASTGSRFGMFSLLAHHSGQEK